MHTESLSVGREVGSLKDRECRGGSKQISEETTVDAYLAEDAEFVKLLEDAGERYLWEEQARTGKEIPKNIDNPDYQRERIFSLDKRIQELASELSTRIKATPVDPRHPDNEPRLLLVGGCVRDVLCGKNPRDVDTEVYGIWPDRLEELLNQIYPRQVDVKGKKFAIFKVHFDDGLTVDISLPRRESKVAHGHKGFEVDGDPNMSIKEAARRRDFTFNTLAADLLTGKVFDEFGGVEDLKKHTLRVTDEERFQDDALRVYRAMQFAARMDLDIDPQSFALMKKMVESGVLKIVKKSDEEGVTQARVTEEWGKLLFKAKKHARGFNLAREIGMIEKYYPEFNEIAKRKTDDNKPSAWENMITSVDRAGEIVRAREKQLFETITTEDAATAEREKNQIRYQIYLGSLCAAFDPEFSTELSGAEETKIPAARAGQIQDRAKQFFSKMNFSGIKVAEVVQVIAANYKRPEAIYRASQSGELSERQAANEVRKLFKDTCIVSTEVLAAVSEAIFGGKDDARGEYAPAGFLRKFVEAHPEWHRKASENFLVNGDDLAKLGVPKGRRVGELLSAVEKARDDGKIETREEALELLNKLI